MLDGLLQVVKILQKQDRGDGALPGVIYTSHYADPLALIITHIKDPENFFKSPQMRVIQLKNCCGLASSRYL